MIGQYLVWKAGVWHRASGAVEERQIQTSNLRVGSSNLSERANKSNTWPITTYPKMHPGRSWVGQDQGRSSFSVRQPPLPLPTADAEAFGGGNQVAFRNLGRDSRGFYELTMLRTVSELLSRTSAWGARRHRDRCVRGATVRRRLGCRAVCLKSQFYAGF
jgi:hypothetical protein